ncbi:MAG: pilus assembly protein PilP [Deltaproteobacteria bacterium]|nr:pilus assembly protein PilP [Deltaproteobacteria bacterium]
MERLQHKYLIGLLSQIIFILALSSGMAAAQEKAADAGTESSGITANTEGTEIADSGVDEYIYDPIDKTDPFKSFITAREEKEKEKAKTYLETLELSQLEIIVIVISPKARWAMVKDSKGVGHVIKEGTLIGTKNGVVYKISEGEVIIREEYTDYRGQKQYREIIKTSQS